MEFFKITKLKLQMIMSGILCIFGILLLIAAFIVPPIGVISSSVLVAVGEVFTFSGALVGIEYSYAHKKLILNSKDEEELSSNTKLKDYK